MIHEPRPNDADNVDEVDESPPHHDPPKPLVNTAVASSALDLLWPTKPLDLLTAWWWLQRLNPDTHGIDRLRFSNTLEAVKTNADIARPFRCVSVRPDLDMLDRLFSEQDLTSLAEAHSARRYILSHPFKLDGFSANQDIKLILRHLCDYPDM